MFRIVLCFFNKKQRAAVCCATCGSMSSDIRAIASFQHKEKLNLNTVAIWSSIPHVATALCFRQLYFCLVAKRLGGLYSSVATQHRFEPFYYSLVVQKTRQSQRMYLEYSYFERQLASLTSVRLYVKFGRFVL